MWIKVLNIENSLFPDFKESLRIEEFSSKESKFVNILDFAEIEKFVITTSLTNPTFSRCQTLKNYLKLLYTIPSLTILETKELETFKYLAISICVYLSSNA